MGVPGLPLLTPWHISLAEDGGCGKSCQSYPSAQLSSAEVLAPGPVEFPRSMEKMLREGRKVAGNDCLPSMQVLTSSFQQWPSWPWFALVHWSMRGSGLLPPGLDPWQPPLPCCPQGPEVNHHWDGRVAEVPRNAHVAPGIWGSCPVLGSW